MSVALKDSNSVASLLAVLNTDTIQGTNLVRIAINESNNSIKVTRSATIGFIMNPIAPRDQNYVNVWCFEGSDHSLYPAVGTATGELLVNSS